MEISQLLKERKVIICVGTGGVGKTTTSAALGVRAAQEGQNVLIITVDPAKRLATSLGIDPTKNGPSFVEGQNYPGRLEAAVIQPKSVFDDFIQDSASSDSEASKMMNNRLYRQLTTQLSGSQEFTSLEVLVQMVRSEKYDLVILDTPPATHAMDFLRAPMKLHSLFQSSVTKWFTRSREKSGFLQRVISSGTDKVFSALHQLTGAEFIGELREFFELAESWQEVLSQRMVDVHEILTGSQSAFVLVSSFDHAKLKESYYFQKRLKREGYLLAALIVNRAFPDWLEGDFSELSVKNVSEQQVIEVHKKMYDYYLERKENLKDYISKIGSSVACFHVPDFMNDIYDLEGVEMVASKFKAGQQ